MSRELHSTVRYPHGEPKRSLRISIIEGCFAMVNIAVSTSALVTSYALMLGATYYHLSLLFGLTALSSVGHVLGSRLVGIYSSRRKVTVFASVGGRFMWSILCALPFIDMLPGWRLGVFLAVVFVSNVTANAAGNAWLSWMADLVPEETRGRYFGKRSTIMNLTGMVTANAVGMLFDVMKNGGREMEAYVLIFGTASLMIVISGLILWRQWEPPAHHEKPLSLADILKIPFASIKFRYLLLFFIYWSFATALAAPFFQPFMLDNLKMSQGLIARYGAIAGLIGLVLQPVWGRLIDRVGSKPVMIMNVLGVCFLPLVWLFPRPDFLLPLWFDAFLTGVFWSGLNLSSLTLIIAMAPKENRSAYIAAHGMVTGITAFLAAMTGGVIMDLTSRFQLVICGLTLINFHIVFIITTVLRLAMVPMALGINDEKSHSMRSSIFIIGDKVSQIYSASTQNISVVFKRFKP